MDVVECRGCGQPVFAQTARCWRCGHPVLAALMQPARGLNLVAQIAVIGSVFAVVLLGMLVLTQRQQAIDEVAVASARAVAIADQQQADDDRRAAHAIDRANRSSTPTPTPAPAPDAGGPGTYTVQPGDCLFSVAADLAIGPNELVFWNKDHAEHTRAEGRMATAHDGPSASHTHTTADSRAGPSRDARADASRYVAAGAWRDARAAGRRAGCSDIACIRTGLVPGQCIGVG